MEEFIMKRIFIILLSIVFLYGCAAGPGKLTKVKDKNLVEIKKEGDTEYEVIVMDPGFDTWFQTTWSPAKDRSLEYYKHWNQRYVSAWNEKVRRSRSNDFFDTEINYNPGTNYGIEVERVLYYYFRWVDTKLGIPILDTPPPGGIL